MKSMAREWPLERMTLPQLKEKAEKCRIFGNDTIQEGLDKIVDLSEIMIEIIGRAK